MVTSDSLDLLVGKIRSGDRYKRFQSVLDKKRWNEMEAKKIIEANPTAVNRDLLKEIFLLVDEPYTAATGDGNGPWFGRLIKPNALKALAEDDGRIANWFKIVGDSSRPAEDRIDRLREGPDHIYGVSVGFTTLMFYVLDRSAFTVWFEALHEGALRLNLLSGKYRASGRQYTQFNNAVKNFAKQYGFDDVEMDWVLQEVCKFV